MIDPTTDSPLSPGRYMQLLDETASTYEVLTLNEEGEDETRTGRVAVFIITPQGGDSAVIFFRNPKLCESFDARMMKRQK